MLTFKKTCAALAPLLLLASAASAGDSGPRRFRLTTVLESTCDPGVPPFECPANSITPFGFRCPAINSWGTVAVQVEDENGRDKVFTVRRDGTRTLVADANTRANGGPGYPTTCDDGFSSITSDPSINELNEVSFQANLRRLSTCPSTPGQQRQGIFLGGGGPLKVISHTINGPEANFSEYLVADSPCNTLGMVAIVPEIQTTFDSGLFTGNRSGNIQKRYLVSDTDTDFRGISQRVSLNELGQIAFQTTKRPEGGTSTQGIFLSNPDGTFRTLVDAPAAGFDSVFDPSLNNLGRLAFQGFKTVEGEQVIGIFTTRGGAVTTEADNSARFGAARAFSGFQEPSINDLGMVAFAADTNHFCTPEDFAPEQGVFAGGDVRKDKVLSTCDTYQGLQVTGVTMCSEGLNNSGEIVMLVGSSVFDPETFTFPTKTWVVKATPLPDHP
jgi:hypothetical protein